MLFTHQNLGQSYGNEPGWNRFLSFKCSFLDSGSGAVNTTPDYNLGSGTATVLRATTAWTRLATGLYASVAAGSLRSYYDTGGVYRGYLPQNQKINYALQSDDLTQAATWVATTMTTSMTATGADGAANSATILTATAGNAIILQTLVRASAQRITSCWIKRRTGSGVINMTQDNGVTWTPVTVTADWTQVAIAAATAANPILGLQIVTNTDAVDVMWFLHEEAAFASATPIPTTSGSVTQNGDQLSYPSDGNFDETVGTAYAEIYPLTVGTNITSTYLLTTTGAASGFPFYIGGTGVLQLGDGTNFPSSSGVLQANTLYKTASSWGGNGLNVCKNGGTLGTGSFDGALGTTITNLRVGWRGTTGQPDAGIQNVRIFNKQITNAQALAMTV